MRQAPKTSKLAHVVAALGAVALTTLVVASNYGLAQHYTVVAETPAAAKGTTVAARR